MDVTETNNAFDATGTLISAFGFASGDTLTMHWTAKDGTEGYAGYTIATSAKNITSLLAAINGISSFDGTAAWTSGTGLTITADVSGASSLDLVISNGTTSFNLATTTEGKDGQVKIHFGTGNEGAEDFYYVDAQNMTKGAGGLNISGLSISTQASAAATLGVVDAAIIAKDTARAHFGAMINRLEATVSNLTLQTENIQAAESQISDVDVAFEMTQFMNTQIKAQAAVAMLAQANATPQLALSLLG